MTTIARNTTIRPEIKKMSYKALETKLISNRVKYQTADLQTKRELIKEDHEIMVEMDRRWNLQK